MADTQKPKTTAAPAPEVPNAAATAPASKASSAMPPELKGFNWAAFLWSWIWGIGHKVWISLIILIPFAMSYVKPYKSIGSLLILAGSIWLGFKGNEYAWKAKKYNSAAEYLAIQKKWLKAALIFFISVFVLAIVVTVLITLAHKK